MLLYELKFSWIELIRSVLPSIVISIGFSFVAIKYWKSRNIVSVKILSVLLIIISIVFLAIFILDFSAHISTHKQYKSILFNKTFETVSGPVENFKSADLYGKGEESFSINGVVFSYANYEDYIGYHKVSTKGGIIERDGQVFTINYVYDTILCKNVILRIYENKISDNTENRP